MASLLRAASLLRHLATKLHKKCDNPACSVALSSPAAGAATPPPAGAAASSAAPSPAAASPAAVSPPAGSSPAAGALSPATSNTTTTTTTTSSGDLAPPAILRLAAAAARAAAIIPRKALPTIPFCNDDEYALAQLLGMKAPPATYWTLPPVNPARISALSRDGNPPAAFSSLPTIEEGEEPAPEPSETSEDDDEDRLSDCFSTCSSLRPEDGRSGVVALVDPLFTMLWAKVQRPDGEEADDDDDDDEDDDDDNETCSYTSNELLAVQEKCSAFISSWGTLAHDTEPTAPSSSICVSVEKDELSEPVGVEQALDSSFLRPAPLSVRKKMVEPDAHPEPKRVLVTYDRGATHCQLHPTLDALCLHLNA